MTSAPPTGNVARLMPRAGGREPPHDFAVERALLAACLMPDAADLGRLRHTLKPEHFADPLHGRLYEGMLALHERGQNVSPFTLAPLVDADETVIDAGGPMKFLSAIGSAFTHLADAPHLAQQIVEYHARRRLLDLGESIIGRATSSDLGTGAADHAAAAAAELRALSSSIGTGGGALPLKFWSDVTNIAAPDRLVQRLLGEAKMAVVYGLPKCGKSFLVSHLALCLALGWPFFGRKVLRGACLYVAAEGAAGMTNRIAAFRLHHGLSGADDAAVPFAIIPAAVNLGPQGADVPRVIAAAEELRRRTDLPVVAIFLDTLARVMPGADENSAGDMGMTIGHADAIKTATGATVVIVHHSGKSQGAGMRGSSALLGAVDTVVAVEKQANGDRVATIEAQRDGADGDVFNFRLDPVVIGQDDEGEEITSAVVIPTEASTPVAAKPRKQPVGKAGLTFRALQHALNDSGADAPTSNHIPRGARVVSTALWREYAYKMMPDDKADTRRKAFTRGYEALIGSGHACSWGDHAWIP